jgi:hypothetical protein
MFRIRLFVGWGVNQSRVFGFLGIGLATALGACAGPTGQTSSLLSMASAAPGASGLSQAARYVSQIASRNGDRDFLMLDKPNGQIIIFENGRPTYSGAALTGESLADRLEPDAVGKTFAESKGLKYKVTPAGRYTVSMGFDPAYGDTLDVNEIQGSDWDIAIHKVWLGAPSEHRDTRLRTPGGADKHITYGCVDVDGTTMQQLVNHLPDEDHTPIYILPMDDGLLGSLFRARDAAAKSTGTAG